MVTWVESVGPFGVFPMLLLGKSTQVIVELVAHGTSEVALTGTSVSGESVKHTPSGVPLVQLSGLVGVTLLDVVSIEVPAGAAVSVMCTPSQR